MTNQHKLEIALRIIADVEAHPIKHWSTFMGEEPLPEKPQFLAHQVHYRNIMRTLTKAACAWVADVLTRASRD